MEVIARRRSGRYRQSDRRGLTVARRKLCASQGEANQRRPPSRWPLPFPFAARRCKTPSMMPTTPLRGFHSATSSSNGPYIRTPPVAIWPVSNRAKPSSSRHNALPVPTNRHSRKRIGRLSACSGKARWLQTPTRMAAIKRSIQ